MYPSVGWSDIKAHVFKTRGVPIADQTYRRLRDVLVSLGYLELIPIDTLRKDVRLTDAGIEFAFYMDKFVKGCK